MTRLSKAISMYTPSENRTQGSWRAAIAICFAAQIASSVTVARPMIAQNAAIAPKHAPIVTHHQGTFNGQRVDYTATVGETIVANAAGTPAARLVSIAYTRDGADPATRPVMFVFNGGPIGPSYPLHMGAFGPKRVAYSPDLKADPATFPLVDNTYTVLDVADLVFFDPASTGYSRVLDGISPQEYYTTESDAQQLTAFVDRWLRENNRMASPKYMFGESYGTIRLPETARQLLHLPEPIVLDGIVLMGQATNQLEVNTRPYNIIAPVIGLPSVAATAWYHNRIDRRGRTVRDVMAEAAQFANNDYLNALFKGSALKSADSARIANRLRELTGIPAEYFRTNNLRITRPTFQTELFKAEGLKLGSDDARYIGPASGPDPAGVVGNVVLTAFKKYARDELKIDWPDQYRQSQTVPWEDSPPDSAGAAAAGGGRRGAGGGGRGGRGGRGGASGGGGGAGGGWTYAATGSPFADFPYTSSITEVINKNPRFRVLVGSGIYDMKTTTGAAEYLIAQSGWPRDRARISYYEGGHMAYSNEAALKKLTDDVRLLLQGK